MRTPVSGGTVVMAVCPLCCCCVVLCPSSSFSSPKRFHFRLQGLLVGIRLVRWLPDDCACALFRRGGCEARRAERCIPRPFSSTLGSIKPWHDEVAPLRTPSAHVRRLCSGFCNVSFPAGGTQGCRQRPVQTEVAHTNERPPYVCRRGTPGAVRQPIHCSKLVSISFKQTSPKLEPRHHDGL